MAKKTCSKDHIYDSAIYGDNCPFCPSGKGTIVNNNNIGAGDTVGNLGSGAEVNQGSGRTVSQVPTIPMGDVAGGGTIIRPAKENTAMLTGRRIVGLFVTYNTVMTGQVFNIYEGRNYIGRDVNFDINIKGDLQVSNKHFSVLYRVADGKFKFKDEQSSNGTFLNDVLTDEGELTTFDVIRVGSTKLIFIAIPQIQ